MSKLPDFDPKPKIPTHIVPVVVDQAIKQLKYNSIHLFFARLLLHTDVLFKEKKHNTITRV